MESSVPIDDDQVILHDFSPRFKLYKSGRVERLRQIHSVSPSPNPHHSTAVLSKDVVVSPQTGVSARIFIPKDAATISNNHNLPLLIYAHGGAFCMESAFSSTYHRYVTSLVSQAKVLAVSVDYRLAPENPIPACHDDSWAAIQWVASHRASDGPEPWLNHHADFSRVFLAGDSAGANIVHDMLIRVGSGDLKISGAALIHPFFGNGDPDPLWECLCPGTTGADDPRLNPAADPARMATMGTRKALVCLAGKDRLKRRGVSYYEALKKSGWGGEAEIVESEGKGHVFHLSNPDCHKALALLKSVASFLTRA